ncbi:MAG: reverse transcriptase domain-containing protein [Polyangiaceae bacterium]
MIDLDFSKMTTAALLCAHLQTTPDTLRRFLRSPESHYTPVELRKRGNRRPRLVFEVSPELGRVHRSVSVALTPYIQKLPEFIQGFRKERGIRSNAALHVGAEVVVTADVSGFFDHIGLKHVRELFRQLGAAAQPALLLARLCTLNDRLPQGGRASPAISNLAVPALDRALAELAPHGTFSRYADDLTFSGGELDCPSEAQIAGVLGDLGFALRPRSYRRQYRRSGQIVTGLSLASSVPTLTRQRRRSIERDLHVGARYGIDGGEYARLKGIVHAAGGVDRDLWKAWCKKLDLVKVIATEDDDPE